MKMIFVCTGNTCRSPMAEVLAASIWPKREILSRGLTAREGAPANEKSVQVMKGYGLDLSQHKAKLFRAEEVDASTLILTMTTQHQLYIEAVAPHLKGQVHTLLGYGGLVGDVIDPYGGSLEVYEACAQLIEKTLLGIKQQEVNP